MDEEAARTRSQVNFLMFLNENEKKKDVFNIVRRISIGPENGPKNGQFLKVLSRMKT